MVLADRAIEMAGRFAPAGPPGAAPAVAAAGGRVHATWFVGDRVVQRLNTAVFADPVALAHQVARLCQHLHRRLAAEGVGPDERARRALSPLAATDGGWTATDDDGGVWRAFVRVPGAVAASGATPAEAAAAGVAFGRLLVDLAALAGPPLAETIPGFKDFAARRETFEAAVADDACGRVAGAGPEVEQVRRAHVLVDVLDGHRRAGRLPVRPAHNDAKAANVLLDQASGEARCVVDLDTAGPGSPLFDAGDLLRSTAVPHDEEAATGRPLAVRDNLAAAALGAWLAGAGPTVEAGERALLPLAGPLMAYENAMRFLTDHLQGDHYYGARRPGHNLDRARIQLAVLHALESARPLIAGLAGRP